MLKDVFVRLLSINTVTGTHRGEYMGLQPTGKSITYNEMKQLGATRPA